jgi:hypothetical protein
MKATSSAFTPKPTTAPTLTFTTAKHRSVLKLSGKKVFKNFKVAFGPQLWWGANPAVLAKYSRQIGKFDITGIFHEDLDRQAPAVSSFAVPIPAHPQGCVAPEKETGAGGRRSWAASGRTRTASAKFSR